MQIGMIGLGRMGANMVRRLMKYQHECVVYDQGLTAALYTRFRSRQEHTFAEKMLSAMRQKFGGHVEQPTLKPTEAVK